MIFLKYIIRTLSPVYVLQMFSLNVCFKAAQLTKIGSESSMDELENLLAQKKDLCFGSGKPHWMASASICPSGGAETTKAENMTTDDERENLLAQADLPYWMPSDSIAPSGSAKMTKAESMTKVI
jgi:hypothetical protein